MRMLVYIAILLVGLLIALIGLLGVIGSLLPVTHTASVTFEVAKPQSEVWVMLDKVEDFPSWFPDINRVELLPEREGRRAFRQFQGRNSFVLEETLKQPMTRVVRTITDDNAMFSGSWDHQFEPAGEGRTRITLTETGSVKSPIPRAIMKLAIGEKFYLNRFARCVTQRCGK
jgi:uncharacterized membrane protein